MQGVKYDEILFLLQSESILRFYWYSGNLKPYFLGGSMSPFSLNISGKLSKTTGFFFQRRVAMNHQVATLVKKRVPDEKDDPLVFQRGLNLRKLPKIPPINIYIHVYLPLILYMYSSYTHTTVRICWYLFRSSEEIEKFDPWEFLSKARWIWVVSYVS